MTTTAVAVPRTPVTRWLERVAPDRRLVGLDLARCVALLGMVATHVVDESRGGLLGAFTEVSHGRASALFATLAGVTLALLTGGRTPVAGRERVARSSGLLVRCLVLGLVGLLLGGLDSGLAVILVNYALLLALGLLVVGLRAPALAGLAAVWVLVGPLVAQVVRPELPDRGFDNPTVGLLGEPVRFFSELLFTGYYPVFSWVVYLLAGMALGRLGLRRVAAGPLVVVAAGGAVLAAGAYRLSDALVSRPETLQALLYGGDLGRPVSPPVAEMRAALREQVGTGLYGQTPVEGPWQWLLVAAPHSTTPFDLATTVGSALFVLCACLLLERGLRALPGRATTWSRAAVAVVAGAGAVPLSAYALHVVMRSPLLPPVEVEVGEAPGTAWYFLALLLPGALLRLAGLKGPLEALVTVLARGTERGVAALVRPRSV